MDGETLTDAAKVKNGHVVQITPDELRASASKAPPTK